MKMKLDEYPNYLNSGRIVIKGSDVMEHMNKMSQEVIRITMDINTTYHTTKIS